MGILDTLAKGSRRLSEELEKIQEERKRQINEKNVDEWLISINDFLSFKVHRSLRELMKELREACRLWCRIHMLTEKNAAADSAISAFFKKGKIRDLIDKASSFLNRRIDTLDDAEEGKEIFYSNYISFIEDFMNGLNETFSSAVASQYDDDEPGTDDFMLFIKAECSSIPAISCLPKDLEILKMIEQDIKSQKPGNKQRERDIDKISEDYESLFGKNADIDSYVAEVKRIKVRLKARIAIQEENIQKGMSIYTALRGSLSQAWFDELNPERGSSRLSAINTLDELKEFYREKIQVIQDKLREFLDSEI